ncbi:MAG TPA: hypothetical protein VJ729_06745 [Nitrososphaeraceae archaeon]|nr:hypothetical protein [Nitrososphaeraceae archaeon]
MVFSIATIMMLTSSIYCIANCCLVASAANGPELAELGDVTI